MKLTALLSLVTLCSILLRPVFADPPYSTDYWVSPAPVGSPMGTIAAPYDGSTRANFDSVMNALPANCTIHLLAGTFHTWGYPNTWWIKTGQKIVGSGINNTIIHLDAGGGFTLQNSQYGGTNIECSDFTLDLSGDDNVNGLYIYGDHSAIRRVKVTNIPLRSDGLEQFPLTISGWCPQVPLDFYSEANVIEDCEVIITNSGYYSCICMGGGPGHLASGTVRNNRVYATKSSTATQKVGINIGFAHEQIVEGNQVFGTGVGIYSETINTNLMILHNQLHDVNVGIFLRQYASTNVTISDNIIGLTPATANAVVGLWMWTPGSGLHQNISMFANTIHSVGAIGPSGTYVAWFQSCNGFTFVNNKVQTSMLPYSETSANVTWFNNFDLNGLSWSYNQDPAHGVQRQTAVGSSYTLQDSDRYVGIQNNGTPMTIFVPTAAGRAGKEWTIVREDTSGLGFSVSVIAPGGYYIMNVPSYWVKTQTMPSATVTPSINLVSDGTNWWGRP